MIIAFTFNKVLHNGTTNDFRDGTKVTQARTSIHLQQVRLKVIRDDPVVAEELKTARFQVNTIDTRFHNRYNHRLNHRINLIIPNIGLPNRPKILNQLIDGPQNWEIRLDISLVVKFLLDAGVGDVDAFGEIG